MPTPERLVTEDMLPNRPGPRIGPGGRFEMDNKVANFLAVRFLQLLYLGVVWKLTCTCTESEIT
jgi:hypothetical protein